MPIKDYKNNIFAELIYIAIKHDIIVSEILSLYEEIDELILNKRLILEIGNRFINWSYQDVDEKFWEPSEKNNRTFCN